MKVVNLDLQKSYGEISLQTVEKYMVLNNFSNVLASLVFAATFFSVALIVSYFLLWITTAILAVCLFCVLIFATIATLGVIYFVSDFGKAWSWFGPMFESSKTITEFLEKIYLVMPYVGMAALVAAALSIALLAKSQNENKVAKIVWLSISIVILIFCVILEFFYKGGL